MKTRSLVLWAIRIGVIALITTVIALVKPVSVGWAGFIAGFFVGAGLALGVLGYAIRHHWRWPPR